MKKKLFIILLVAVSLFTAALPASAYSLYLDQSTYQASRFLYGTHAEFQVYNTNYGSYQGIPKVYWLLTDAWDQEIASGTLISYYDEMNNVSGSHAFGGEFDLPSLSTINGFKLTLSCEYDYMCNAEADFFVY